MEEIQRNPTKNYPILVVDDNRLQRTILEAGLKAAGYEVVAAENGKEGLDVFRKGYYPIVMTDWVMPEMNGLELCRAIRSDDSGRYTYIILLTSQDSKNDIIAGLEAGADEYLIKPAHQAELVSRLKTAKRILELEISQQRYIEEIKNLSLIDPVTGVFNRRYMDEHILQEIKRAYRYERSLSVILVSITQFRDIIVAHGHYSGDVVLKQCADCLGESIRKDVDWLARYGEDSFMVVLAETDMAGGMIVAKRLRLRIASLGIRIHDKEVRISASFGVAGFTASQQKLGMTADVLIENADRCLTKAQEEDGETIKGVQIG
ncbi:diguanylate cyclase [Geobacter sp. AOG2]|uniref:diguanylate cyclase n=1 Tax=Geobacter sp. AOG2 TaxID=1566347 RepID=UPI001CC3B795|nr:diguanylate cyclase [Geobacter sp. AOG2]GFE61244.1 diguanylate cyclase response regulator [Geobacter sp. AOG2]